MDFSLEQVSQAGIDQPVLLYPALVLKLVGPDFYSEMSLAIPCAGVTDMQMAFIDHIKLRWMERGLEQLPNGVGSTRCHGFTWTKGLTVTLA
jgi:hypothetical protein